jgi:hypothetical protein
LANAIAANVPMSQTAMSCSTVGVVEVAGGYLGAGCGQFRGRRAAGIANERTHRPAALQQCGGGGPALASGRGGHDDGAARCGHWFFPTDRRIGFINPLTRYGFVNPFANDI